MTCLCDDGKVAGSRVVGCCVLVLDRGVGARRRGGGGAGHVSRCGCAVRDQDGLVQVVVGEDEVGELASE